MTTRVEGKIALVTGAASGLGAATAQLLAEEGATVILADINQAGADVATQIGGEASFRTLDVTQEASWRAVLSEVDQRHGRLDILVNNAGIVLIASIEDTSLDQYEQVLAVNATGVFLGCKEALPLMKRSPHASIVNISSVASHQGFSLGFAYGASKGAVRTMTKSIAAHCQDQGYKIRCNSIHPNEIETPMMEKVMLRVGESRDVPDGVLPAGALGSPKDVAYAVLYLASNESRFLNGSELSVDNGSLIRPWASNILAPSS